MPEVTANKPTSKASVLVGCRFPSGLILRIYKMVSGTEVMPGGRTQTVKVAAPVAEARLRGYADPSKIIAIDPRGRYGVTEVDAGFFEQWLKDNAESDLVKNGIVFAADTEGDLKAKAKEMRGERTGLEPLAPGDKKDERISKKIAPVKAVDEEAAA